MERRQASDFDQELLDLFDEYVHGIIERREFLDKAAKFAVGGLTAAALLDMLSPDYALAKQVDENDARIKGETIEYSSPKGHGKIKGYLVRPAGGGKRGGVVVVHENRGLNPYIADVARRAAVAGFTALAPDGLTPLGGYPGNDPDGKVMQRKLDKGRTAAGFLRRFRSPEGRRERERQGGRGGLLLRGRRIERHGRPQARPRRLGSLLRPPAQDRGRGREDQGAPAAPLRRIRPPHQQGMARL